MMTHGSGGSQGGECDPGRGTEPRGKPRGAGRGKRRKRKGKGKRKRSARANGGEPSPATSRDLGPLFNRDDEDHMAWLMAEARDRGVKDVSPDAIVRQGAWIVAWDNLRRRHVYLADAYPEGED